MDKHCKGCPYHINAGRRHPNREQVKYNDWCSKRGGVANVGWCRTHNAKPKKETP